MDARLWAGEPRPTGGRQFGHTGDVVFFPPHNTRFE
jgi:hypothetical protein